MSAHSSFESLDGFSAVIEQYLTSGRVRTLAFCIAGILYLFHGNFNWSIKSVNVGHTTNCNRESVVWLSFKDVNSTRYDEFLIP